MASAVETITPTVNAVTKTKMNAIDSSFFMRIHLLREIKIPLDTCVTTQSENHLIVENYREIAATVSISEKLVAEINLQILQAAPD